MHAKGSRWNERQLCIRLKVNTLTNISFTKEV